MRGFSFVKCQGELVPLSQIIYLSYIFSVMLRLNGLHRTYRVINADFIQHYSACMYRKQSVSSSVSNTLVLSNVFKTERGYVDTNTYPLLY